MVVRFRVSGLGGGGVLAYGRKGGRGEAGYGGDGGVVGGVFAPVFSLARSETGLAAIANLLELGVDAVGLVEFDADFGRCPLTIGTREDVGGEGRGGGIWA